jgi:hypothetical protein
MAWRDQAERLDRNVVRAFDYGDVIFQKMDGDVAVGAPASLPAEFDATNVSLDMLDGNQISTVGKALYVHYADLPTGVTIETEDRFIIASGEAAGTYAVDDVQPNADMTGAQVLLKRL